jgi:hypothetical protein
VTTSATYFAPDASPQSCSIDATTKCGSTTYLYYPCLP